MGIEDRRALRSVGFRLLSALAIYLLGAAVLMGVALAIPFVIEVWPELTRQAAEDGAISQAALLDRFQAYLQANPEKYSRTAYLVSCLCAALGALVFLPGLKRDGITLRSLYARPSLDWSVLPLGIAVAFGLNFLGSFAVLGTEWLFNRFGYTVIIEDDSLHTAAYYVYAILLAPVAEEFMFRGGVLRVLKPHGEKFALAASGLCFAFFHGNLHQFPGTFLMGLWFGYLYLRSGSLALPTLTHMGLNAVVIGVNALSDLYPALDLIAFVLFLGAGYLCFRRLYGRLGKVAPADAPREVRMAFYGTLPMIAFFTLCLYNIVSTVSPLS